MRILSLVLTSVVMVMHLGFLGLEVFFYQHPLGLSVFKISPDFAQSTAHIMFNQGIYNGFLALALLIGLVHPNLDVRKNFSLYGLICVVLAGIAGAVSVSGRIFFIQSMPALLAIMISQMAYKKS